MFISDSIKYIGVNDRRVDLFEGQYVVPNGISYNSYVIFDEQIAVMDTVDANFTHEWLDNLQNTLGPPSRLSDRSAHGARPCRQHQQLCPQLS